MGDDTGRAPAPAAFDPHLTPVPRRRVLLLIGVGAMAGAAGLGSVLAGCTPAPVPVELDVDPDTLVPGTPVEVPFTVTINGNAVAGSAWLVRKASGELIAYDPRCTHALCAYAWDAAGARFRCKCHDGQFALDGTVLAGRPRRPLDRLPVHLAAAVVEVDVPGDFQTPKESLPA
jgi:nitrite reductase/ring-hydroxylating ferredoxin subunit